jgi:outer membrane translocation and assembly module TamA
MHIIVRYLAVSLLVSAGLGQLCFAQFANNIRIGKLVIESNSLPDADRERLIRLFQQKTYPQPEIGLRIGVALRNLGYLRAAVDEPRVSFPSQGVRKGMAQVTIKVKQGTQYRLGEIQVQKATIFPYTQLRNLFSLHRGEIFNEEKIEEGVENLRKLYETKGYVNFVADPETSIDESRRTIDLFVDLDEGKPYNFGQLQLEGIEPHAGAGHALLNSWKMLEGKRYNSLELQHWLLAHHVDWKVDTRISDSMRMAPDPISLVVNVKLTQWPEQVTQ